MPRQDSTTGLGLVSNSTAAQGHLTTTTTGQRINDEDIAMAVKQKNGGWGVI